MAILSSSDNCWNAAEALEKASSVHSSSAVEEKLENNSKGLYASGASAVSSYAASTMTSATMYPFMGGDSLKLESSPAASAAVADIAYSASTTATGATGYPLPGHHGSSQHLQHQEWEVHEPHRSGQSLIQLCNIKLQNGYKSREIPFTVQFLFLGEKRGTKEGAEKE